MYIYIYIHTYSERDRKTYRHRETEREEKHRQTETEIERERERERERSIVICNLFSTPEDNTSHISRVTITFTGSCINSLVNPHQEASHLASAKQASSRNVKYQYRQRKKLQRLYKIRKKVERAERRGKTLDYDLRVVSLYLYADSKKLHIVVE